MNRPNGSASSSTFPSSSAELLAQQNVNDPSMVPIIPPEDQPEMRAMICQQALTISLTIFGNLLMIFVILRNNYVLRRKRITPVQMLMLHMCTSDLLFALLTIFPTMIMTLTVPNFYGPDILCKLVKFLQVLPMYTSSFLLVAISADRYNAICRPLANIRFGRYNRPVTYAAIAWLTAFLFSTPQFLIFGKNENSNDCVGLYTESWQYPVYVIVFNFAAWLMPCIVAGSLYFCVCRAVWKSMAFEKCVTPVTRTNSIKSKIRSLSECNGLPNEHQHLTASIVGDYRRDSRLSSVNTLVHHSGLRIQREELDRKRVQTVKLTLTIVCTNFLLWAPFCIISIIDALAPSFLNPIVSTYIMFFGNLNSSVNPFIWFLFNADQVKVAFSSLFAFERKSSQAPSDLWSRASQQTSAAAALAAGGAPHGSLATQQTTLAGHTQPSAIAPAQTRPRLHSASRQLHVPSSAAPVPPMGPRRWTTSSGEGVSRGVGSPTSSATQKPLNQPTLQQPAQQRKPKPINWCRQAAAIHRLSSSEAAPTSPNTTVTTDCCSSPDLPSPLAGGLPAPTSQDMTSQHHRQQPRNGHPQMMSSNGSAAAGKPPHYAISTVS